jgi:CMP-N,N'-diacetyllegionaminic acid synthase
VYKNKSFLAIIPARGKSKRLPKKNVLDLAGKPLIAWSIQAGLESRYIDKVIVTSDDEEILYIAKQYGVNIIKRPSILASDTASTFDTIKHTIDNSDQFDFIVLLQPTSPLRNATHIDEAIELLMAKNAAAIISVCETNHSPLWSNTLTEDRDMTNFISDAIKNKRSQDLKKYYRLNGAIYICRTDRLLKEKTFMLKNNIFAYIMEQNTSIDIDNKIDFLLAQEILKETL